VLAGHGGDVKAVDWHPQKALLASASKDTLVKLWDAKNAQVVASLHGHKNMVTCAKWNANGNWLLTASRDQTCKVFDLRMLREFATFHGHGRDVTSVAWHPFHEELFVSGGFDGTILYWMVGHEGPQAEIRQGHEAAVWSLAFHPMGHVLCSGSNDNTVRVWNMATCACEKVFEGHTHYVTCCLQLQQGGLLASLSFDGTIRLWDVSSGQGKSLQTSACRRVITGNPCSTFVGVRLHQLRENAGHLIAGSDDKTVRVWDPATGHLVAELQVPTGKCVIGLWQLADGRIVTSHDDGLVRVWGGDSKMGSRALAIVTPPA